ncbi:hypothetical protein AMAG_07794 [Allomyces macrogynus ATCC 38327]|uniref:Uncharacterized protein n=1 Tax=Allomyces macrogynus (strain ATCC 38327) TaxID=578462 RepID=A0A0L0SJC5_ALLM3|nr:hypothetical protein AMAG_07794 [Allomyces macrogynus ATCC 38327]|eukprot:KNE62592.1 hypothetical protein AMAG_07794 [Allomyces macrogynus ATCC 38327]
MATLVYPPLGPAPFASAHHLAAAAEGPWALSTPVSTTSLPSAAGNDASPPPSLVGSAADHLNDPPLHSSWSAAAASRGTPGRSSGGYPPRPLQQQQQQQQHQHRASPHYRLAGHDPAMDHALAVAAEYRAELDLARSLHSPPPASIPPPHPAPFSLAEDVAFCPLPLATLAVDHGVGEDEIRRELLLATLYPPATRTPSPSRSRNGSSIGTSPPRRASPGHAARAVAAAAASNRGRAWSISSGDDQYAYLYQQPYHHHHAPPQAFYPSPPVHHLHHHQQHAPAPPQQQHHHANGNHHHHHHNNHHGRRHHHQANKGGEHATGRKNARHASRR